MRSLQKTISFSTQKNHDNDVQYQVYLLLALISNKIFMQETSNDFEEL